MPTGEIIKRSREELGYNAEYVAEKVGVSAATMYRYEKNELEPRSGVLIKMADILNVTIDYLLGRDSKVDAVESGIKPIDQTRGIFVTEAKLMEKAKKHFTNGFLYAFETELKHKQSTNAEKPLTDNEKEMLWLFSKLGVVEQSRVIIYADELANKQQEETQ